MRRRIIAALGVAAFLTGAGLAGSPAQAILSTNGADNAVADDLRFSYVGLLHTPHYGLTTVGRIQGPGAEECTAILIAPRVALTASHCISLQPGAFPFPDVKNATIAFGGTRRSEAKSSVNPTGSVTAKIVDTAKKSDLMLLLLDRTMPFTPALLATTSDSGLWAKGAAVEQVGWGGKSLALRRATQQVTDSDAKAPFTLDTHLIETYPAGTLPGYAQHGDSGGPLLANQNGVVKLVGVTHSMDSVTSRVTYFTRTSDKSSFKWITDNVAKLTKRILTGAATR